ELMRRWAAFSGLSVITHCMMDNHFHLMLWVPDRETGRAGLTHEEIVQRLGEVWSKEKVEQWEAFYQANGEKTHKEMDGMMAGRMYDLPEFMRVLKHGFTLWFNRRHDRKGPLWEGRYRSVVVEGNPLALMSVAAYIDLNPVRAGMCGDPMEYHWNGYGEACGGNALAREGLEALVRFTRGHQPRGADNVRKRQLNREMHWTGIGAAMEKERKQRAAPKNWKEVQAAYRLWVVAKGMTRKDDSRTTEKIRNRKGFDPVEVSAEYERRGEVPMAQMLRQRVRYFTRGVAIGSSAWLEGLMSEYRSCFGEKRKKAGSRMQGGCWGGLEALRQSGQNDGMTE
ncbi:MAG: hypothetical protein LAT83_13815, partial [Kiritimatiellae bacterium]|nr:hypothetical protein [Kiritimatiellia bacterium]